MNLQGFLLANVFFSTRAMAFQCGVPIETASRQLTRLSRAGAIVRITRGIWGQTQHPYFSPFGAVSHLLGNEQGYVSFLSALHRRGVISQIPRVIHVATTGHSRKLVSPIGTYEFFQIHPRMFASGIEQSEGRLPYLMATPEKALLDTFYLSSRKSKRFDRLPEIEVDELDRRRFEALVAEQVELEPIRKHVLAKWNRLK